MNLNLIEVEGASSFENAKNAFSPAVLFQEDYSTSRGSSGTGETPQALAPRRKKCEGDCPAPTSAAGPEAEVVL
ncbi:hypothetical protein A8F94_01855 [Bacillus sp. FJAT-27225]|uniref:hypothetical protein n=1 Tax=Bacillus sp. FJAT-27225 TaxID=1743144 RepID=UPI00080C2A45|nr:hypothetical protein [Bacillus sp. FJAT-27225]OCA90645.1 hypothetical protein A8F94_01855 [Bacillus sp. FJAT-27225]